MKNIKKCHANYIDSQHYFYNFINYYIFKHFSLVQGYDPRAPPADISSTPKVFPIPAEFINQIPGGGVQPNHNFNTGSQPKRNYNPSSRPKPSFNPSSQIEKEK